ncbi:MAG: helix-turn-helix domain-containing protein [Pseudomonadota bacterium]
MNIKKSERLPRNILTVDELACLFKVRKSWIYARTQQKAKHSIPCIKIGKYLRFDESAVRDWLATNQND